MMPRGMSHGPKARENSFPAFDPTSPAMGEVWPLHSLSANDPPDEPEGGKDVSTWMNERILIGLSISSVVLLVLANIQLRKIMSTQADAAKTLRDANLQLQKISGESSRTLQLVKDLQAQIDAGDQVSPELQSAINDVKASVQSVDDLTPDITDGSGLPGTDVSNVMTGSDAQGVQKNVGPQGETGKKGPTAQI